MKVIVFIAITLFYYLENVVPSFAMRKSNDDSGDPNTVEVSIPLIDNPETSNTTTPLFKSISFIPNVVTVSRVEGKLEYEVKDLLLCEKTLDSSIIACKASNNEVVPFSNIRDYRMRRVSVQFDAKDNDETEIKSIIGSELGETEPKMPTTSKEIPEYYTQHIKDLLGKVTSNGDVEVISLSQKEDCSDKSSVSKQSYVNIMPLSIYLPAISDKYSDTSIMYLNATTPSLIQVYLDSFYNMECSWHIHSILQQGNEDGGRMTDVTWGIPYSSIKKSVLVSEPAVSLYKRHKSSFWRWFRSESSTIVTSSNIHIMASGKYIVTYNHRCNAFAKPTNVIRTVNIEAYDLTTSESSTS